MSIGDSASILKAQGFVAVGSLCHKIKLDVWWNELNRVQILLVHLGGHVIVRGSKHYFVRSVAEGGETSARVAAAVQEYLQDHFEELRLSFAYFRDVSRRVAQQHIEQKAQSRGPAPKFSTAVELGRLQSALNENRARLASTSTLARLMSTSSGLLQRHLSDSEGKSRRETEELEERVAEGRKRAQVLEELQRQYLRKGSAANFVFNLCSPAHVATSPHELADIVASIVKELQDADRYEVSQKLGQGRFSMQVVSADDPSWAWVEEWLGGALSPLQLERLTAPFLELRDAAEKHLMVTADEDIVVEGSVKEDQKLLGARVVGSFLGRVDRPTDRDAGERKIDPAQLPAEVGQLWSGTKSAGACLLPLGKLEHVAASGATGAGKSVFVRVITEEAARHKLNVLLLDPRNQSAGLLVPEDRPQFLELYPAFRLRREQARSFPFRYRAPGEGLGSLPEDLGSLAEGLNVVSFKGMDEEERCDLFARIVDTVFSACTRAESLSLRLLIVVEEAQLFTKRRVAPEAKDAASRAENALDRVFREGRKYGLCALVASQSIRDFSHDVASIRQNANTKVFFRNADREVEYAADFLGDGRQIIDLQPGTCMLHNAALGKITIRVRPPFSKLWEFSTEETRRLLEPEVRSRMVSADAQALLGAVRAHHRQHGSGPNLSELATHVGITSKRRLQELVDELEGCGAVRTRKLAERGQPRIIEPIASVPSVPGVDQSGTEAD